MTFFEFNPIGRKVHEIPIGTFIGEIQKSAATLTIPDLPEQYEKAIKAIQPLVAAVDDLDDEIWGSLPDATEFFMPYRVALALTAYSALALPLTEEQRADFLTMFDAIYASLYLHGLVDGMKRPRKEENDISNSA